MFTTCVDRLGHTAEYTRATHGVDELAQGPPLLLGFKNKVIFIESWVELRVRMNYCVIFPCNTNISHHRETNNYLTIPHKSNFVKNIKPNKPMVLLFEVVLPPKFSGELY